MPSFTVDNIYPLVNPASIMRVCDQFGQEQYPYIELMGLMLKTFESQTGKSLEFERGDMRFSPNVEIVQQQLKQGLTFTFPKAAELRQLSDFNHKWGYLSDKDLVEVAFKIFKETAAKLGSIVTTPPQESGRLRDDSGYRA